MAGIIVAAMIFESEHFSLVELRSTSQTSKANCFTRPQPIYAHYAMVTLKSNAALAISIFICRPAFPFQLLQTVRNPCGTNTKLARGRLATLSAAQWWQRFREPSFVSSKQHRHVNVGNFWAKQMKPDSSNVWCVKPSTPQARPAISACQFGHVLCKLK